MEAGRSSPYHPSDTTPYTPTAFVGRLDAYSRMNQHFTDNAQQALIFTGQRHMGKSALLWHFSEAFDDNTIGVLLLLYELRVDGDEPSECEKDLLVMLIEGVRGALVNHQVVTERLPDMPDSDSAGLRLWVANDFLPAVLHRIRAHRRVVLLMDDVDVLLTLVEDGHLATDIFTYFSSLLKTQRQIHIVGTLRESERARGEQLKPLADPKAFVRLGGLLRADVGYLVGASPALTYTEMAIDRLYETSGGIPLLLQRLAHQVYVSALDADQVTIQPSDIQRAVSRVIDESNMWFYEQWQTFSLQEKLVLTAISNRLYRDPLQAVTARQIATWLIETDYPLDETTIRSVIRSLEYQHLIYHVDDGVMILPGAMQLWLLNHAQLDAPGTMEAEQGTGHAARRLWVLIAMSVGLIVMLLIISQNERLSPAPDASPLASTVTLEPARED